MPPPVIRIIRPASGEPALSSRADVVLFAGEVQRRSGPVADAMKDKGDPPQFFTSFAAFAQVFAWEKRPVGFMTDTDIPTTLGLAVQAFFAEGGQACHVVRTRDPVPLPAPDRPKESKAERESRIHARLDAVIPATMPGADEPAAWRGLAHLYGLPDVALLVLPDLPDIFASAQERLTQVAPLFPPEMFRPLSEAPPQGQIIATQRPPISAPRLDHKGAEDWARAVARVTQFLRQPRGGQHRSDVMFLTAMPLPVRNDGTLTPTKMLAELASANGQSPLLQLVYPWVETRASTTQPEGLQSPDGVLAGVLARNALARGAFRSAADLPIATILKLEPVLERAVIEAPQEAHVDWLGARLTLLAPSQNGYRLLSDTTMAPVLSDTTMAPDLARRAGGIGRLIGVLIRAARQAGEGLVFEASGEATWTRLRRRYEALLTEFWRLGALAGSSPAEAFSVRCDHTTMTQADIDNGRLVATISFTAAQPVQFITVQLALGGDGTAARRAA
jgi:uncharacterized protein